MKDHVRKGHVSFLRAALRRLPVTHIDVHPAFPDDEPLKNVDKDSNAAHQAAEKMTLKLFNKDWRRPLVNDPEDDDDAEDLELGTAWLLLSGLCHLLQQCGRAAIGGKSGRWEQEQTIATVLRCSMQHAQVSFPRAQRSRLAVAAKCRRRVVHTFLQEMAAYLSKWQAMLCAPEDSGEEDSDGYTDATVYPGGYNQFDYIHGSRSILKLLATYIAEGFVDMYGCTHCV